MVKKLELLLKKIPQKLTAERFLSFVTENFPSNIIRSKGLFWIASRSNQALVWSSAGGSIKADPAGVWWDSMPFNERINYPSFLNNQSQIESEWHVDFGDRKIELVFIGQNLDVKSITKVLENCLLTEKELVDWGNGDFSQHDNWPIKNH